MLMSVTVVPRVSPLLHCTPPGNGTCIWYCLEAFLVTTSITALNIIIFFLGIALKEFLYGKKKKER